jgi:hypothetical protein
VRVEDTQAEATTLRDVDLNLWFEMIIKVSHFLFLISPYLASVRDSEHDQLTPGGSSSSAVSWRASARNRKLRPTSSSISSSPTSFARINVNRLSG